MDLLQFIRSDLKASRGRPAEVAKATGIPLGTLRKIASGVTPNPRYRTVEKLRAFYSEEEAA